MDQVLDYLKKPVFPITTHAALLLSSLDDFADKLHLARAE
jgi:hypothetical protein